MSKSLSNQETTVYVGNIDPDVTKEQLYELFIQVSPIVNIKYPKDKVLQTYQGYAFIEFPTTQDVDYAIQVMHNTVNLYGRALKVRRINQNTSNNNNTTNSTSINNRSSVITPPIAKLFVKNLDDSIDLKALNRIFKKIGEFYKDPEFFYVSQGETRCAFVFYKYYRDADNAINKLSNEIISGKRIIVDYAIKENDHKLKYGNESDRMLNKEAEKHGLLD